jgi:hypothetical protein
MYLQSLPSSRTPYTLSLGGYSCAHPEEWNQYLLDQIRKLYPDYLQYESPDWVSGVPWKENACILEAIDQFLFEEYGFSLPDNNLFKVFNKDGDGIPPGVILEVIACLIEPFGFEIDMVIVPDDELRSEVGNQENVVGAWDASAFEGRPGICMINIRKGYSHAFFWKKMDTKKFQKSQFRMALTIKKVDQLEEDRSARNSIDIYCDLLMEYLSYIGPDFDDHCHYDNLYHKIKLLRQYMKNPRYRRSKTFRKTLEKKLNAICDHFQEMISFRNGREEEIIRVVEKLVRRIIKEADESALTSD